MKKLLACAMVVAASLTVLVTPLRGQKSKPEAKPTPTPTVTLLVATFREDPGDLIQSDGLGPYYGSSRSNAVAAEFDTDGYLNFWPLHEGRSVLLAFPPPIRPGATALPDFVYEPVTSWGLSTCCRSDPSTNPSPLGMEPGDVVVDTASRPEWRPARASSARTGTRCASTRPWETPTSTTGTSSSPREQHERRRRGGSVDPRAAAGGDSGFQIRVWLHAPEPFHPKGVCGLRRLHPAVPDHVRRIGAVGAASPVYLGVRISWQR